MKPSPARRHWPRGLPYELHYPQTSLNFNLDAAAARYPDKPAIIFFDRLLSYSELKRDVESLSAYLQRRCEVSRGERVLLLSQNCPQFIIAYYAIIRAGAVVVPINVMCTSTEVAYFVADSGAATALVARELLPNVAACLADGRLRHAVEITYGDVLPEDEPVVFPDGVSRPAAPRHHPAVRPWREALTLERVAATPELGPSDLCVLPYTSGTTGHPKGCVHTHGTMMSAIVATALWRNLTSEAVFLAVAPLFHLLGMQSGMNVPIFLGGTIVMLPRWDREAAARLISRYRVTAWAAPPAMLLDFVLQPGLDGYDLSSLALLSGGGAVMPATVASTLKERYGLVYNEAYGMTETASFLHANPLQRGKQQCLGVATFGVDSRVIDPVTLEELPPNQVGELITSAPQLMLGYWNNPEANRTAFIDREGKRFLRTGDLAYMDDEGYYFLRDRMKRMINASGYKVWPAEVEDLLQAHPAIQEVCVIATEDAKRGETVKAVVSLKPEARGNIGAEDIVAWGREHMAVYKAPRIVEFVDALPKSNTGKVLWRQLQEKEWQEKERTGNN